MLPLCAQPSQSPGRPLVWAPASQVSSFCTAKSRRPGVARTGLWLRGARHAGKWSGARSSPDLTRPLPRVTGARGRRGHVATRSEQPRAGSGARGKTRVSQHS